MTTAAALKRVRDRERMRVKNVYPAAMDRHHREIAEHVRRGLGQDVVLVELRRRAATPLRYVVVDADNEHALRQHNWSANHKGYAVTTRRAVGSKITVPMHRLLLDLAAGDPRQGDHINGDPLDCRLANLRIVAAAENAQNRKKHVARRATSQYRGVHWRGDRYKSRPWFASCTIDGRQTHLGNFATEDEAARAAQRARDENMPFAVARDGAWS